MIDRGILILAGLGILIAGLVKESGTKKGIAKPVPNDDNPSGESGEPENGGTGGPDSGRPDGSDNPPGLGLDADES